MARVSLSPDDFAARCAAVELLLLDVDGVLTDGVIGLDDRGVEFRNFFVRDGSGLGLWREAGRRTAILSGRAAAVVARRAAELRIWPVEQGTGLKGKLDRFRRILADLALEPTQIAYMGDDLPDLPVLSAVGLAACPADAVAEVRTAAHVVTDAPGGRGAVRELIELILRQQGRWDGLLASCQVGA
jgi:3-deoxy-D-manno-octulosonate 8-phosphate phosphatase (KDO 8-P phosphatase)